jgi:hypothetical protein
MATLEYIVYHSSGVNIPETPRKGGPLTTLVEGKNESIAYDVNYHEMYSRFLVNDDLLKNNIEVNSKLAGLEKNNLIIRVDNKYKSTTEFDVNGELFRVPTLDEAGRGEVDKFYSSIIDPTVLKKWLEDILIKEVKR